MYILIGIILCVVVFVILDARTTRGDGVYLKESHPYRKLMPFVMRTRNESLVYFDMGISAHRIQEFIREREGIGITQCIVASVAKILQSENTLNRFVSGGRLYQRNNIVISFSMKRKKMGNKSKIAVVRQVVKENDSFRQICRAIEGQIHVERSDKTTYADKEYSLLTSLPRFALRVGVWFVKILDDFNLLPMSFIKNDGMYCSAFVANVGSLGMPPGYHHLYEWGNCPLFITTGAIEERVVAQEGKMCIQETLPIRIAFDERINDALGVRNAIKMFHEILENPENHLI